MSNFLITVLTTIVGIVATVIVSRHYYTRSIKKALVPYLDYEFQLLSGIDPDVRKDLSIKFQNIEVDDLLKVQFLVANTGEKPISGIIKPLKLTIPESGIILDATLLHISPDGRDVQLKISKDKKSVDFIFSLLNKDDFFMVKFLIKGVVKISDFRFTITAEDLTPQLAIERLPIGAIIDQKKMKLNYFKFAPFLWGAIFLVLGFFSFILSLSVKVDFPSIFEMSIKDCIGNISKIHLMVVATFISSLFIMIISLAFMAYSFENMEFKKRKRYFVPRKLNNKEKK